MCSLLSQDQTCPPSDFCFFFFLSFSWFVAALASIRFTLSERIFHNPVSVFTSREKAPDRWDINCWGKQKQSVHIFINLEKRLTRSQSQKTYQGMTHCFKVVTNEIFKFLWLSDMTKVVLHLQAQFIKMIVEWGQVCR